MPIASRSGIAWAALSALSGLAKAAIASVSGLSAPSGGGGGGGVTFITNVADYFIEQTDATTAPTGTDPAGPNPAVFAFVATAHSGPPTIDGCRFDGSGGTPLTKLGSDESLGFGSASAAIYGGAPGPTAETTVWGDWSGTPLMGYVEAAFFAGAHQTTPFTPLAPVGDNFGDPTSTAVASVTINPATPGKTYAAKVVMTSGDASAAAFTPVAGTNLHPDQAVFFTGGVCSMHKQAEGTSVTLAVNVNQSGSSSLTWKLFPVEVNPA